MLEDNKAPLVKYVCEYMDDNPEEITAKKLFEKLSHLDTNINCVRNVMSSGVRNEYFKITGKVGNGQHKEHVFVRTDKRYIHKDAAYYKRIKDNEAQHEANRYIMSCLAR